MTDPDILTIQRARWQQRRCLRCGVSRPRATLCVACRQHWRYCPRCEVVYPLTEAYFRAKSAAVASDLCRPCSYFLRSGPRTPRARYLAEQRTREHPLLRSIMRLYRRNLTLDAIAGELALSVAALASIIRHARETGRWPAQLARGKGWRKGRKGEQPNANR